MKSERPSKGAQFSAARPQRGGVPRWMWVGVAALAVMSAYSTWDAQRLEKELRIGEQQAAALAREREQTRQKLARAERERDIMSDPASVHIVMTAQTKIIPKMHAYWHARLGIVVAGIRIPATPSNRALQLWLIPKAPGSKPRSAGLFEQRPDGSCVASVPDPPDSMAATKALAITEEPAGGSPEPTGAPRWLGGLA